MQIHTLTLLATASTVIAAPAIVPEAQDLTERAIPSAPYQISNGGSVPGVFPGIKPLDPSIPKSIPKGRGPQASDANGNGWATAFANFFDYDSGLQNAAKSWASAMGPFRMKHAPFPCVPMNLPVMSKRDDEEVAAVYIEKRDVTIDDVQSDGEESETTMIEKYLPARPWSRTTLQEEREGLAKWMAGEVTLKSVKHGGIFEGF